ARPWRPPPTRDRLSRSAGCPATAGSWSFATAARWPPRRTTSTPSPRSSWPWPRRSTRPPPQSGLTPRVKRGLRHSDEDAGGDLAGEADLLTAPVDAHRIAFLRDRHARSGIDPGGVELPQHAQIRLHALADAAHHDRPGEAGKGEVTLTLAGRC